MAQMKQTGATLQRASPAAFILERGESWPGLPDPALAQGPVVLASPAGAATQTKASLSWVPARAKVTSLWDKQTLLTHASTGAERQQGSVCVERLARSVGGNTDGIPIQTRQMFRLEAPQPCQPKCGNIRWRTLRWRSLRALGRWP